MPPNDPYLAVSKCTSLFPEQNKDVGQANLVCQTSGFSNQTCIKMTRSSVAYADLNCSTSMIYITKF